MADFRVDQAAGLRRMLGGGGQLQVVTFVAGCEGVGRSVAIANLGVAEACRRDACLRRSLAVYQGQLTHEETAHIQDRKREITEEILDLKDYEELN